MLHVFPDSINILHLKMLLDLFVCWPSHWPRRASVGHLNIACHFHPPSLRLSYDAHTNQYQSSPFETLQSPPASNVQQYTYIVQLIFYQWNFKKKEIKMLNICLILVPVPPTFVGLFLTHNWLKYEHFRGSFYPIVRFIKSILNSDYIPHILFVIIIIIKKE